MSTEEELLSRYQAAHAKWKDLDDRANQAALGQRPPLTTEESAALDAARQAYLDAWDALASAEEARALAAENPPSA